MTGEIHEVCDTTSYAHFIKFLLESLTKICIKSTQLNKYSQETNNGIETYTGCV